MLDTIFKPVEKVIKSRIEKFKLKEKLSKRPDYIAKAKEIWGMINEDLGISDKVENKLKPKVEKFNKALMSKFPELTEKDVKEIRESIVEQINASKEAISSQVENFTKLKETNAKLQEENLEIKEQLSKLKSEVTSSTNLESNEPLTAASKDSKQEDM